MRTGPALCAATLLLLATISAAEDWPPYVIDWPESTGDVLLAETSRYRLLRFSRNADGVVTSDSRPMSIGRRGEGKRRERDLRSPLGVYFLTGQIDTRPLHAKYGVAAFPMDYPNARDKQLGRSGDGIWLHGVIPGTQEPIPRDTDGCLAINNAELSALMPALVPQKTPVLVARRLEPWAEGQRESIRDELLEVINSWSASYSEGRLRDYLNHYSGGFTYRGLSLEDWSVLKFEELGTDAIRRVSVRDPFLAADPEEAGLFVSRFSLEIEAETRSFSVAKRLYWRRDADGVLKIIAEDET